ncbi:hypothetical protein Prudu_1179S000200, partial [Prunus dulcis]
AAGAASEHQWPQDRRRWNTIESPTVSNRSPLLGRPELAGKPCFPTEVPSKSPELPAQNSPSFLHQIDRAVEARGIHHWANYSFRTKVKSFGIGQNTGETLPNFRQKSKGILKGS